MPVYRVWDISQLDQYSGARGRPEDRSVLIEATNIENAAVEARSRGVFARYGVKEFVIVEDGRSIMNGGPLTLNVSGKKIKREVTIIEGVRARRGKDSLEDDGLRALALKALRDVRSRAGLPHDQSVFLKERWLDPEYRENIIKKYKKAWEVPGYREKQSQITRERWENPEFREKTIKRMKERGQDPDRRARHSERVKKLWEDPEFRDKVMRARAQARKRKQIESLVIV